MRVTDRPVREVDLYLAKNQKIELSNRIDKLKKSPETAISQDEMHKFIENLRSGKKINK